MIAVAASRPDAAADTSSGAIVLLPHYVLHPDGLQTIGGRSIALPAAEQAVIARYSERRKLADHDLSRPETDAVQRLIAAGYLIRLPPHMVRAAAPIDVVLSPHIDDAALSLGGSIALSERTTLVVNIFTRQSYQTGLRVPPAQLDAIGCAEDRIAARLLNYCSVNLGLAGAQDRHRLGVSPVMGKDGAEIFARFGNDVDTVTQRASAAIRNAVGARPIAALYAPAAIGGHLDHVVVALAAPRILNSLRPLPIGLIYYEDLPYAAAAMRAGIDLSDREMRIRDVTEAIALKRAALGVFKTRLRSPQADVCIAHGRAVAEPGGAAERSFVIRQPLCTQGDRR